MDENYYKIYLQYNFAYVKFNSETITFKELKRINDKYKADTNYSNIHSLLIEVDKRCKHKFSLSDINKLSRLYDNEPQTNNHNVTVWLVSQPIITALTHLFISQTKDNSKYCSTLERAYKLLNLPVEFDEFEELIKD